MFNDLKWPLKSFQILKWPLKNFKMTKEIETKKLYEPQAKLIQLHVALSIKFRNSHIFNLNRLKIFVKYKFKS